MASMLFTTPSTWMFNGAAIRVDHSRHCLGATRRHASLGDVVAELDPRVHRPGSHPRDPLLRPAVGREPTEARLAEAGDQPCGLRRRVRRRVERSTRADDKLVGRLHLRAKCGAREELATGDDRAHDLRDVPIGSRECLRRPARRAREADRRSPGVARA